MNYKYLSLILLFASQAFGQLTWSGQIRTRSEYRDGAGTLRLNTYDPALFISQRTRLTSAYKSSRVQFQTSIQDVRVWGQDASTISAADGTRLGVHEAWAEISLVNKKDTILPGFVEYLGIKLGRQELMYDDSRILGNLDWLQQGRRHDALVLKLINKGWRVDLGMAYNQNTDAFQTDGSYYVPGNVPPYVKDSKGNLVAVPAGIIPLVGATGLSSKNGVASLVNPPSTNALGQNYKSMQFLYLAKNVGKAKWSGVILSDQFGAYILDSTRNIAGKDTAYVFGRRYHSTALNARWTLGSIFSAPLAKAWNFNGAIYYQTGKDKDSLLLDAFTSSLAITYQPRNIAYTFGWDVVSGNDAFSNSKTNHRFDPLYGTPHKFWGLMDYFYAGTGSPAGGLSDLYLKSKYVAKNKRFSSGLDLHYFALAADQKAQDGQKINPFLGIELDWVSTYVLNKFSQLEMGFSVMQASDSMESAKGFSPGTTQKQASWAYLQLNILL
jgi:hypothetical protein